MDKVEKILDAIGSYFHLDLKYYTKNSFYLLSARVISRGLGFLLSIFLARLLTKDLYGQWNYIFSIIGMLAIFTLPGMNTAVIQAVAGGHDKVLITGIKEKFKWSILGSVAVLGVGVYYFLNGLVLLGKCFMISSLFFPFFQNFQVYNAFLTGKKRFDKVAKYLVVTQVFTVLATLLAVYLTRNLMLMVIASLASNSLIGGYFFRSTLKSMESLSNDPQAISFSRHLTATQIPSGLRQHYDKLIIGTSLSFSDLAIYSIALGFSNLLNPFRSTITTLIFPKLSQMDEKTAYSEVRKRLLFVVLGFGIPAGILVILCPYIIPLLYSQKYVGSIFYAQLLLVSMIIAAPVPLLNKALFPSQKKVNELYKLRISSSIVEVVLLTVLVLNFGLLGAIIAKILVRTYNTIYSLKLSGFISTQ
jgi:O-antigen/teichoic acid export membrane protein